MKSDAIIIQTVAPDYRKRIFDLLSKNTFIDFKLYTGNEYFEPSVKTKNSEDYCIKIKNIFLFNRSLLFQLGLWEEVFKSKVAIIEMNPRIISNWFILFLRKVIGKKTILWGHAWPRKGVKSKSDIIRNIMRLLADEIIVYTKQQSVELQKKMPRKRIRYAPNALYFEKEMGVSDRFNKDLCNNIIYVGRLTEAKKIVLLLKSFHKCLAKLPKDTNLLILGDGEKKGKIKKYIEQNNLQDRIILFGHVSDYSTIKKHYETSLLSVSPGYVGLSITQSLGFGVPMLISKGENHSPELEAADKENSVFFKTDNIEDLSEKLMQFFKNKNNWITKRIQISKKCSQNYSVEKMAKTFIEAFKNS
jgi:glycosyltransferase involved in cell wall biosynthesis